MNWDKASSEYLEVAHIVFGTMRPSLENVASTIVSCLRAGGRILACGNGGSAADAQHFAAEMINRFLLDRNPLAAISLTTDTSVITSIANDYGYEHVFAKQVVGLGRPGDILFAISTSGRAVNVLRAVATAAEIGMTTVGLTGGDGGNLASKVDYPLVVSCTKDTPRIQEGHQLIIHLICQLVEELMFQPA